jgi:hypothetical protein
MQLWSLNQISNDEKENILSKHREVYNGYQTLVPQTNNTQPLYVQDFAKDKSGAMVNNDGTVTPYTNYRINESHVMDTCNECGGVMSEGECSECGWKGSMEEHWQDGDPQYTRIKQAECKECGGMMKEGECSECGYKMEETKEGYKTGKLDDIYHEEDLNLGDDFDYVEGGGNDYGTFEKMHHMKTIKNEETATSTAPMSFGKHYDEIEPPYDFKSNGPVGDGGTLRQKNIKEQTVGGGNAAVYDPHFDDPSYDFVSDGPIEDTYTEPANDMDLDSNEVEKPFDFVSDGPEKGDSYPVFEEMHSAWDDEDTEELDEVDISGVQGMYGRTKKPYAFVSTGPGKAGPYQTNSWGGEQLSSDMEEGFEEEINLNPDDTAEDDIYWEKDLEPGELDLDLTKFNPEDKSWEEITAYTGEDEFSHLAEDKKDNLQKQQEKILEMFLRVSKFH